VRNKETLYSVYCSSSVSSLIIEQMRWRLHTEILRCTYIETGDFMLVPTLAEVHMLSWITRLGNDQMTSAVICLKAHRYFSQW